MTPGDRVTTICGARVTLGAQVGSHGPSGMISVYSNDINVTVMDHHLEVPC